MSKPFKYEGRHPIYAHVYVNTHKLTGKKVYKASIVRNSRSAAERCAMLFDSDREAAIYIDKLLIKAGKEPVNILKPLNSKP